MASKTKKVKITELSSAIVGELTVFDEAVMNGLKSNVQETMKEFVAETKKQKYKQDTGKYRKAISSRVVDPKLRTYTEQWYVKDKSQAHLTAFLNDGHQLKTGGRSVAYHFVDNANEKALKSLKKRVDKTLEGAG